MGLTVYGTVRTGYKLQNLEKLYQMKDYSIVGSSLMGTDIGLELHVDVKIGQHNGRPLIASYWIFEDAYGEYSYGINQNDFSTIGKPEHNYNCYAIEDTSVFSNWNKPYVNLRIGGNGYQCVGTPMVLEYDKEKVKKLAFWCLENHYIPELKEVFSLIKPVEEMKVTPDKDIHDKTYKYDDEIEDMLKANGVTDRILAASGNFQSFVKKDVLENNKNKETKPKKDVYFGYVYEGSIHEGRHYSMVVLEGSEAVAKFVCDPKTIGNDKMITDVLDRMMFSTYGIYINQKGKYGDPNEIDKLIEKVIEEQSKMFENDNKENNDNEKGEERV